MQSWQLSFGCLYQAVSRSVPADTDLLRLDLKNASSSSLTWSLSVVHRPCGAPLMTFRTEPLTIFAESSAESAIGTIWSSSPCRISVGTSIFLRSSVRSVSENALMQKYEAGKPAIIPWSQNDSRTPSETLAPGRL